jgi:hypothetical protein
MFGVILLLLGAQFRAVDQYVLNRTCSKFAAEKFGSPTTQAVGGAMTTLPSEATTELRTVKLPVWTGWATISVGAVLVLHSLAMKRPD